jgi:GNAT superfamily N-acetyltransferase
MMHVEGWDPSHPRWEELLAVIEAEGQLRWTITNADYHCSDHMLAALDGDEIVGFLRYVRQPIGSDSDCPPVLLNGEVLIEAKVLAFGVVPNHQRRGVGRLLQLEAIHQAQVQGCYQLRSHSAGKYTANHHLKLSLGFAVHPIVRGDDRQGVYFILPLRVGQEQGGEDALS